MFRGRHEHSIDAKGRMSIPSGFRVEIQRRSEKPPILTNYQDHLALHPADEWDKVEEGLLEMRELRPEVQNYRRFIVSGAVECPIDNQGRILIPAYLREHAGLKNKATVAGVLDRIELWEPTRFAENHQLTLHRLPEIQLSVDQAHEQKA